MRILYIAEIVGKAGVYAVKKTLGDLKKQTRADFVIACADRATGGGGLGRSHAAYLRKLGVQAITLGECAFYKKDLVENMEKTPYILRPANFNTAAPGYGSHIFRAGDAKIAVTVMIGQSGFSRMHGDNPAAALPILLERLRQETPTVVLDFHAGPTAEKRTLFALADGLCSAVVGSHTRVQTADETVLPNGTAVITDAGRTGSIDSVGGTDAETRIREFRAGIPDWSKEAWDRIELQGALVAVDRNGRALSIERISRSVEQPAEREQGIG